VYDASDDGARDLAERFVGIGRASGPTATAFLDVILPDRPRRSYRRAAGLSGDALTTARRLGRDAGYIVAVDSRSLDPCRDVQALMDAVPWLDTSTIVPLVDTRVQAVVRRGRNGITAEWDGGLLVGDGSASAGGKGPDGNRLASLGVEAPGRQGATTAHSGAYVREEATRPAGMHRRPSWPIYFRRDPKR
jgi:hypothetical protein